MESKEYAGFIHEAFIDPIRSVLIIDDDYPTFDEILARQMAGDEQAPELGPIKTWHKNPQSIKDVIGHFRAADRSLLVDIHDGSNVEIDEETEAAKHLLQSDLLVLDYQLDRDKKGDGTKAIKIARSVLNNPHFNLVVVHTSESLDRVFPEMLVGLMAKSGLKLDDAERAQATEFLEEREDEQAGFTTQVRSSLTREHYLYFRKCGCQFPAVAEPAAPSFDAFNALLDGANCADQAVRAAILRWGILEREKQLAASMNKDSAPTISWSAGPVHWLRSDTVFMAFSNKGHNDDLLAELMDALSAWKPRPSRLFLAKLRAEIEEFGVAAESQALGNNHVLAHWYSRLLKGDGAERDYLITETVARHSEQLLDFVLPKVHDFARRLIEADKGDPDKICDEHFKVDLKKPAELTKAYTEHNAFVGTKKVEGYHLGTGHIFKVEEDVWVCLSPLCDLVPGRKSEKRFGNIGNTLPFIAVRLQKVDGAGVPKKIQSNRFIFLKLGGEVSGYCLNDQSNEGAAPHWFTLYAANDGIFDKDRRFGILRIEAAKNHRLVARRYDAEVIAQLRYEYALNLLHKLGNSMTRVGLDFAGP